MIILRNAQCILYQGLISMSVLLRLAPRNGVAADLFLHVDKKRTSAANPTKRYLLNPEILSVASLRAVSAVERAFMPPTPLND